jgi:hypothetical protein
MAPPDGTPERDVCWMSILSAGSGGAANTALTGQRLKPNMHPMRFMGPKGTIEKYNRT